MCLTINTKANNGQELTAKEDIRVYKILRKEKNKISSPYLGFKYKPNTLYRLRKKLKPHYTYGSLLQITEGFHSYQYPDGAKYNASYNDIFFATEFIIPKGAKYYIGLRGDIVSSSIRSGSLKPMKN